MSVLQTALERFLDTVWVRGDIASIGEFLHADVVFSGLESAPLDGLADYLSFHRMVHAQLSNIAVRTLGAVEADGKIALLAEFSATDLQSGRRASTRLQMMMRYRDGLVVEGDVLVDYMTFFEQIGRLPERTLDLCLLEHRLEPVLRRA